MTSAVAGILKPDGGLRIVVTPLWRMKYHVQRGERLFVVPGFTVQEPVTDSSEQAGLIERTQRYVLSQVSPTNHCGECRQCCKTLYINEDGLTKPSHQWCNHCDQSAGCMIHWKRPKPCRTYECIWLKSQKTDTPMSTELRPDKTHVVLSSDTAVYWGGTPDPNLIEVHVDRDDPQAAEREPIAGYLRDKKTKHITYYYGE